MQRYQEECDDHVCTLAEIDRKDPLARDSHQSPDQGRLASSPGGGRTSIEVTQAREIERHTCLGRC